MSHTAKWNKDAKLSWASSKCQGLNIIKSNGNKNQIKSRPAYTQTMPIHPEYNLDIEAKETEIQKHDDQRIS